MSLEENNKLKEFNKLYRESDEIYHKICVKQGLSDSAFMILYALAEFGEECRQKDIAAYFCLSKQTINSSIQKLIKEGFVELEPAKGRDIKIILTDKGSKLIQDKIIPVIDIEKDTFASMGEDEAKELIRLTRKYVEIFKEKTNEML